MKARFWGANAAMVVGALMLASGVNNIASGSRDFTTTGGIVILLCASAYKSVKKRKLGLVKSSGVRVFCEYFCIVAAVAVVVLQNNLIDLIYTEPVSSGIVHLLWGLIAFVVISLKEPVAPSKDVNPND